MTAALLLLRRVPREAWYIFAALLALWAARAWVDGQRAAAFKAGAAAQKTVDEAAFKAAQAKAEDEQRARLERVRAADAAIFRKVEDGLRQDIDDVQRRAAALRLRWQAARADQGGSGGSNLPRLPSAAARADDAACTASGGLSFNTALPVLEDAEQDAARLRALQDWINAQAKVAR